MKNFNYFILILLTVLISFSSCKSCKKDTKIDVVSEIIVENVTSLDKQYMFTTYGENYKWVETSIKLVNYLDEENDGSIESITNVFQVIEETEDSGHKSADVFVIFANHTVDSTEYVVKKDFWIESTSMNNDVIKLSYKDAFKNFMQTNLPKPHSKNCVLRKSVGPLESNPQYIFGNTQYTIWVDAVTGEVREYDPSFPSEF